MVRDLLYRIVKTKEERRMYYSVWNGGRKAHVVCYDSKLQGLMIESIWFYKESAARRVHWLNGGGPDEFIYCEKERQDA